MAIRNKIAKSFPMWFKGSIIIAQFSKYKSTISQNRRSLSMLSILKMLSIFSGSRGPDGPDLPLPFWRKFQLSVHTLLDDGRSISRNVAEKHDDSRHDKLKNSGIQLNRQTQTYSRYFRLYGRLTAKGNYTIRYSIFRKLFLRAFNFFNLYISGASVLQKLCSKVVKNRIV